MRVIKVYSHIRSGTNYLSALLALNLYPGVDLSVDEGSIGHWADRAQVGRNSYGRLFGGHATPAGYFVYGNDCYIYRDGRDVALSLWNSKHFINPEWRSGTFSEFIRRPLDWSCKPSKPTAIGKTIFEQWAWHLDLWQMSRAIQVCYEELVLDPEPIIVRIAKANHIKMAGFSPVTESVGWFPSSDNHIANWRGVMSDDDLAYFEEVAGSSYGVWRK